MLNRELRVGIAGGHGAERREKLGNSHAVGVKRQAELVSAHLIEQRVHVDRKCDAVAEFVVAHHRLIVPLIFELAFKVLAPVEFDVAARGVSNRRDGFGSRQHDHPRFSSMDLLAKVVDHALGHLSADLGIDCAARFDVRATRYRPRHITRRPERIRPHIAITH